MCEASNAGLVSLQGKPESALFPPAAYRSVTTASEEQSAHTSHLPTTQFLHPSPPHPKARPRLRTRSGSNATAAARSPLETRALRLQMSYNFLQRKPTEYQAKTVMTASQHQPAIGVRAPRTLQPHISPLKSEAAAAPGHGLSPPPSAAVSAVTHGSPPRALPCARDPQPPAPLGAVAAAPRPTARAGRAFRRQAHARGSRAPPKPAGRSRDSTRASPPTPAPPATTAPSPPPLAIRSGHGAAEAPPPGAPQTKPRPGSTWRGGSGGATAAYSLAAPANVLFSPLESIFQKSRFLPAPPSPKHPPKCHGAPTPKSRVPAVVTSPRGWGRGILSDRVRLCPARVELL